MAPFKSPAEEASFLKLAVKYLNKAHLLGSRLHNADVVSNYLTESISDYFLTLSRIEQCIEFFSQACTTHPQLKLFIARGIKAQGDVSRSFDMVMDIISKEETSSVPALIDAAESELQEEDEGNVAYRGSVMISAQDSQVIV